MTVADFPALDASLNSASALCLMAGYAAIRRRHIRLHATMMISAAVTSSAFLACYLIYHAKTGTHRVPAGINPTLKLIYLCVLFPHLTLAMLMLPMIIGTFWMAATRQWARHMKIARPTFWVWLYVSISGLVVYWMLYRVFHTPPL